MGKSILKDAGYMDLNLFESIQNDVWELIAMLVSTVKTTKNER